MTVPRSPEAQWGEACRELRDFVRLLAPKGVPEDRACEVVAAPLLVQAPAELDERFVAHLRSIPEPRPDQVLVVEDKDASAGWLMDKLAYQWRGLQCVEGSGVWTPSGLTAAEAAARVAAAFRRGFPPKVLAAHVPRRMGVRLAGAVHNAEKQMQGVRGACLHAPGALMPSTHCVVGAVPSP